MNMYAKVKMYSDNLQQRRVDDLMWKYGQKLAQISCHETPSLV